jgi:hypothetical protein
MTSDIDVCHVCHCDDALIENGYFLAGLANIYFLMISGFQVQRT